MEFNYVLPNSEITFAPYNRDNPNPKHRFGAVNARVPGILFTPNGNSKEYVFSNSVERAKLEPRKTGILIHLFVVESPEPNQILLLLQLKDLNRDNSGIPKLYHVADQWNTCTKATINLRFHNPNGEPIFPGFYDVPIIFRHDTLTLCEPCQKENFRMDDWANMSMMLPGTISLTVKIHEKEIINKDALLLNRKIMEDAEFTDAVIVASNGARLACHKNFLAAQSAFFSGMFGSGMQEDVSGEVHLDISEAGVKAMLSYIYCCEIEEAAENCELALELLMAADQYQMRMLEQELVSLLTSLGKDWWNAQVAVELWQYANKKKENENYRKLLEKTAQVLKMKPENEIKKCPAFQLMLENTDPAAIEFCLYFMKIYGPTKESA